MNKAGRNNSIYFFTNQQDVARNKIKEVNK